MAANIGRWWKYAQAKLTSSLDSTIESSNAELDDLEAEQAARAEGKPWIASDGTAPTLEETRARIEWEAEEQRRRAEAEVEAADSPADGALARADAPPDPEVVKAQLELDRQARESKDRLDAIRKELGVEPPAPPPA